MQDKAMKRRLRVGVLIKTQHAACDHQPRSLLVLSATGAPQPKLKGWSLPNKRMREDEPMELAEEVQLLYSYGLEIDDSSSSSSSSAGSVDDF